MHWQALQFVSSIKSLLPEYFICSDVLEVGSHSVNGSVRSLFDADTYIGLDLSSGEGVDVVESGHEFKSKQKFDIVISCECFEHNPFYAETFSNMTFHLKNDGLIIFTCASTGRPEHGTSRTDPRLSPGTSALKWEYYKNLVQSDFDGLVNDLTFTFFFENRASKDLYFVGTKSLHLANRLEKHRGALLKSQQNLEQMSLDPHKYFINLASLANLDIFDLTPECLFFLFHSQRQNGILDNHNFRSAVDKSLLFKPDSSESLCIKSEILALEGKSVEALVLSKRAWKINHTNYYRNHYADSLARVKRFSKAVEVLQTIPNAIENVNILLKIADYSLKGGSLETAFQYINSVLIEGGRTAIFLHKYMQILVAKDELLEAKNVAKEIIQQEACPKWITNDCNKILVLKTLHNSSNKTV